MLGTMARYGAGRLAEQLAPRAPLPLGTLAVNVVGCLLIGLLAGVGATREAAQGLRLFLLVGVLGGFTTFSALGLETTRLLHEGALGRALLNVGLHLALGLAAADLGLRLARA